MKLPTLFISHGSPMLALEPGRLGPLLGELGRRLPRPRAVLVLSPHWLSAQREVLSGAQPATVHDFGGFPRALYGLQYPAPGAPEVAAEVIAQLARAGLPAQANPTQGFDHGAWVPLRHLYPHADVPLLQLAQPTCPSPLVLLELGRALAPLRERGILIVGSGSLTHNLREWQRSSEDAAYVQRFADWIWQGIDGGDLGALLDYRSLAPDAIRAHPTDEHLLPLYFAIGAAGDDWPQATRLAAGISDGVMSMDSFVFGERLKLSAEQHAVAAETPQSKEERSIH